MLRAVRPLDGAEGDEDGESSSSPSTPLGPAGFNAAGCTTVTLRMRARDAEDKRLWLFALQKALLVFIILFIQRRPRGLFPLKGRAVEA